MARWLIVALAFVAAFHAMEWPTVGADNNGQYLVGGGVGALPCTQFLNAMAEARQEGGLTSIGGAERINSWSSYVLGFETGYNAAKPGVQDIFGTFGQSPANDVLYAVEARCQKKPDQRFGSALVDVAASLYEESTGHSPR